MSNTTDIGWTNSTWNCVTGCSKYSDGCKHCYAAAMTMRLKAMRQAKYKLGFDTVVCHEDSLAEPLNWRKPRMIFVNSMGDTFHKDVPVKFIKKIFAVMCYAKQHTFQVLTKRSERLRELGGKLPWAPNICAGVTVESGEYKHRIDDLKKTGAHVKFISIEPMIGPVGNLNLKGIDWVIVGGESGPGARPMLKEWVIEVRDQCVSAGVPFFFKQWGGFQKKKNGRLLDGREWNEMPKVACGGKAK